jgi:NADH-ubiquinone oxidoreductase chain 2
MIFIVAAALPSLKQWVHPILTTRIASIVFIYAGVLSFNTFYIQSIGSGIGVYSGLFQVTTVSQLMDTFIFFTGSLILISWPTASNKAISNTLKALSVSPNNQNIKIKYGNGIGSSIINYVKNKDDSPVHYQYSLIVLFSSLGASLLISSADLISMYLSIELQSFGVYILTSLHRDSILAVSAGLKYFLLGGLSSCFILLGAGLVYTYTGLTNLESIYSFISVPYFNNISQGFILGFSLIVLGLLFKVAAAPLHNWAPDVYDDSPAISTIWLTIMPKISLFIFLLELYSHVAIFENMDYTSPTGLSVISVLKNLLLLSSLLSLIIGSILGLSQIKIRRLLGYSTINHVGFLLLALSINTESSINSFIFYIVQYTLTNLNTFLILIAFGYMFNKFTFKLNHAPFGALSLSLSLSLKGEGEGESEENTNLKNIKIEYGTIYVNKNIDNITDTKTNLKFSYLHKNIDFINELKGKFLANPLLSLSLCVCLFSLAGVPPLIGFFSKQFVLSSAIQSGYYFMAIIAIIVSVISASYYLKIVRLIFTEFNQLEDSVEYGTNNIISKIYYNLKERNINIKNNYISIVSNLHCYLISSLTFIMLFFIVKPSLILNSTHVLSLTFFD